MDNNGCARRNKVDVNGHKLSWHHADFKTERCIAVSDKMEQNHPVTERRSLFIKISFGKYES